MWQHVCSGGGNTGNERLLGVMENLHFNVIKVLTAGDVLIVVVASPQDVDMTGEG